MLARHLCPPQLPAPPDSVDYSQAALACLGNVYDNDTLGDCVIAGAYHVIGVATGNASGSPFIATNDQIVADYSAIGGYVPGQPGTDQGCDEQAAIAYWSSTGFADGSKLAGSAGVDGSNQEQCKQALNLFENLYFGMELPDEWITPFPSSPGFVWDVAGDPNPSNGHCVMACGYDADGVTICTWGMLGKLTWGAIAKYAVPANGGELYTLLTPDLLAAGQQAAPNGMAWGDLVNDLARV
jgi:hypothetical protein